MSLSDYRTLGRSGLRVGPLALGAMTFDDGSWGSAPETSFDILDRYLDAGGNFVDTANMYSGGASEQTLGEYFAARPGRMVLTTKFGGSMDPHDPNSGGAGRKAVRAQLDASLRRLNTDHVDLYWMHQWDRHTPVEETLSTLDDLVRSGKVHAIGLSNTPPGGSPSPPRSPDCAAPSPSPRSRSSTHRSPDGRGRDLRRRPPLRAGRHPLEPPGQRRCPASAPGRPAPRRAPDARRTQASTSPSRPSSCSTPSRRSPPDAGATVATTALAWVRQRPEVTSTLIGARTPEQLEANLASLQVTLSPAETTELDELTTPALDHPHPVTQIMIGFQQGDTTVNGLSAHAFVR